MRLVCRLSDSQSKTRTLYSQTGQLYFLGFLWYDYRYSIFRLCGAYLQKLKSTKGINMKKYKNNLFLSSLIALLGVLAILLVFLFDLGENQIHTLVIIVRFLLPVWVCGNIFLFIRRDKQRRIISRVLIAGNIVSLCVLLLFCGIFLLAANRGYTGSFSLSSSLFENKNVMVIVPHQDDDINLVGGLIEQYTQGNSEVTVVFTTNGDKFGNTDTRAEEAVSVLTTLGVKKANIYYLGFGDQWQPQAYDGQEIPHIYNSVDPDAVWTSAFGATATYGTPSIPCYRELPYTRNSFLHSLEELILEIKPDTIFATDFDDHIDHKATDLLFEEALCNILKDSTGYHPTVYKGFCYGTAWKAVFDHLESLNLLSTKKPDDSTWNAASFGYTWEDRVRFPMSSSNLSIAILNNSVYKSLIAYSSQEAFTQIGAVLNGDKVFWERRTDSLLYGADILVDGEAVSLLNDFKLKDFTDISISPETASGTAYLDGKTVRVNMEHAVSANCIYLYDNPSGTDNILEGYLAFSDGSRTEFGALNSNGSATVISFPEKQVQWFEIVPTKTEGEYAGLSEIEMYRDVSELQKDTYLMAVDSSDNFVYDYIIPQGDTAAFQLYSFPHAVQLSPEDVTLQFESDSEGNSFRWDNGTLTVSCETGSSCTVTVSAADISTTFTVSNPSALTRAYLTALQHVGKTPIDLRVFFSALLSLIAKVLRVIRNILF